MGRPGLDGLFYYRGEGCKRDVCSPLSIVEQHYQWQERKGALCW